VANHDIAPTSQFARNPDLDLNASPLEASIRARVGAEAAIIIPATAIARKLLGDDLGVNMLLLGVALQRGLIGVSHDALERAIELNAAKVEFNKRALALGRLIGHDMDAVRKTVAADAGPIALSGWKDVMAHRAALLVDYQNSAYAERYRVLVRRVAAMEAKVIGDAGPLALAVSHGYFKLLAYKDEYEVARLWTDPRLRARLDAMFEPGYRLRLSLAPQIPWFEDRASGRIKKRLWGPWIFALFRMLAAMRRLRGTPFDICQLHPHRRRERALIGEYEDTVAEILRTLTPENHDNAVEIARLPESIRGYGIVKERSMAAAKQRERELRKSSAANSLRDNTLKQVS
jgi:indolepyruvate ferredoxin oxidoreductase